MRIGGRAAVGLLAGCLLVAGCSSDGGEEAVTLPPATTIPSPTPSVPATPSEVATNETLPTPTTTLLLPEDHVETVDAFVVDLFAALNGAKASGNFAAFDALYLPTCTDCADLRDEVEAMLAEGRTITGGDWIIVQQSSEQFPNGAKATGDVFAYRTPGSLVASDGSVERLAAQPMTWFQLAFVRADPWHVEGLGIIDLETL